MSERTRLLLSNIILALGGRILNVASNLVMIPICLNALGTEQYGLLAVVMSLNAFFSFADFGLGSALVNDVAAARARGDNLAVQTAISQTWYFLAAVATLCLIAGWIAYASGVATTLLPQVPPSQVPFISVMLFIGASLGIPFAIAQRIYSALQKGALAQGWAALGRLMALAGAITAYYAAPSLEAFVFVLVVVPTLVAGLNIALLFAVHKDLRPSLRMLNPGGVAHRLKVGLMFAAVSLFTFTEVGLDPLFFGQHVALDVVAENDVVIKLFSYVPSLISIALVPLWPALTAALASHETSWVSKSNLTAATAAAVIGGASSLVMLLLLDPVLRVWLGEVYLRDPQLRCLIAAFIALQAFGLYQLYVMNALGLVAVSAAVATAFLVVGLPLKLTALGITRSLSASYAALIVWYLIKIPVCQLLINNAINSPGGHPPLRVRPGYAVGL